MLQYNYWEQLTYEIDENFPELISHSPYPQNYYNLSLEKHLAHVSLVINTVTYYSGLKPYTIILL